MAPSTLTRPSQKPAPPLGSAACLPAARQEKRHGRPNRTRRHRTPGTRGLKRSGYSHGPLLFKFLLASHAVPHRRRRQKPQERYGLTTRLTDAVVHDLNTPQGVFQSPDTLNTPGGQALVHRILAQARGQFVFIGTFEGNLRRQRLSDGHGPGVVNEYHFCFSEDRYKQ